MAKKYFWLKLKTDFFKGLAMKKLRRIAGGDTYTIIYLKLQLLSIKDEGNLFYQGVEGSFYEEMALELDEDVENVRATILFLESVGLLKQVNDSQFTLTEVPFLIGSESESAERVRRHREKQAIGQVKSVTKALQCNTAVTECNDNVQPCNTEIEKEIEIDKEKDIEIEIETEGESEREKKDREPINYHKIVDMYNDTCVSLPRVTSLSDARKKAIRARLKTYTIEDLEQVFIKAERSDFLKGRNDRNWNANFDWLLKDSNIAKVLDGNYDNIRAPAPKVIQGGSRTAQQLNDSYDMITRWAEE